LLKIAQGVLTQAAGLLDRQEDWVHTMATYAKVRRMRLRDGQSIGEIARRTSLSRNTIKARLRESTLSEMSYRRDAGSKKLDGHRERLRQALEIDAPRPRKGRRALPAAMAGSRRQSVPGVPSPARGQYQGGDRRTILIPLTRARSYTPTTRRKLSLGLHPWSIFNEQRWSVFNERQQPVACGPSSLHCDEARPFIHADVPTHSTCPRYSPSMINARRFLPAVLLAPLLVLAGTSWSSDKKDHFGWLFGTWTMTVDEDHGPADSMTFRADGTFASYDDQCREHANSYFVRKGMVFLVIPQAKGPVALVLVPDASKSTLTFTSPRTQNNAVYERSGSPHCLRSN
jgi:hypothetical protein